MRMRIHVGWTAVRCPSRMTDTDNTLRRMFLDFFLQCSQTTHRFFDVDFFTVENGNTGRVISSVFQFSQAVN